MLILFDHGTPAPLRSFLKDRTIKKTKDWLGYAQQWRAVAGGRRSGF
jgi:hypothetical protein